MDITGKIIQALPEQGGTSRNGNPWRKREYVLETQDTYPRKVCFSFMNDRIDQNPLQVGQMARVYFDLESREFNGRWYTDVRAWKAEDASAAPAAAPQQPAAQPYGAAPAPQQAPAAQMPGGYNMPPIPPTSPNEDLPF